MSPLTAHTFHGSTGLQWQQNSCTSLPHADKSLKGTFSPSSTLNPAMQKKSLVNATPLGIELPGTSPQLFYY